MLLSKRHINGIFIAVLALSHVFSQAQCSHRLAIEPLTRECDMHSQSMCPSPMTLVMLIYWTVYRPVGICTALSACAKDVAVTWATAVLTASEALLAVPPADSSKATSRQSWAARTYAEMPTMQLYDSQPVLVAEDVAVAMAVAIWVLMAVALATAVTSWLLLVACANALQANQAHLPSVGNQELKAMAAGAHSLGNGHCHSFCGCLCGC